MGVSAGGRVAVGVWIDIVEDGPTMGACRTTGSLSQSIEPNLDDFGIWAKVEGGVTTVRRLTTDEVIVQARGWAKAMQALADKFGEAVEVSCDPSMGNAVTAKMVGTWQPDAAIVASVALDAAVATLESASATLATVQQHLSNAEAIADVLAERAELEADPTGCGCELGHECGWAAVAGFPEDAVTDAVADYAVSMGHSEISLNEWEADLLASEPKTGDADSALGINEAEELIDASLVVEASATQPVAPELTDYQRYAPVKASQAQPCGCPGIGGHFHGCPELIDEPAASVCEPTRDFYSTEWMGAMRPARKGRVSRRGKTTRRQRARNRG